MTPTKPIDGTLLAAFQRFADLSHYWHRANTPDSLAVQELEERHRLERDIPELIKRLTAFADVGTTHLFDVAARVKADPPREEAGQGFRMLTRGDYVRKGDQCNYGLGWEDVTPEMVALKVQAEDEGHIRRRIAKDAPKDTAEPPEQTGECPTCGGLLERRSMSLLCLGCGWTADTLDKREETPVKAQETASEEAWRELGPEEIIRSGDESGYATGNPYWSECAAEVVGCPAGYIAGLKYRRRLTPPSPAKE